MSGEAPVRVLFIGGMGRSGSTLLDRMLGSTPGAVSIGEFRKFWRRGLQWNEVCGCGQPIPKCPFWTEVVRDAFGGFDAIDHERLVRVEDRLLTNLRNGVPLRFPRLMSSRMWRDLGVMLEARVRMFRSIAKVADASLVIDSSKGPLYGQALRLAAGLDVYGVHLVRDSRAVAHSWARRKTNIRVVGETAEMPRLPAHVAAAHWLTKNAQMSLAFGGTAYGRRVFYEAFARAPYRTVRDLLAWTGQPADAAPAEGDTVHFGVHHTVLGNPMRFEQGEMKVRIDDEWRRAMPWRQRAIVTAITAPLLAAYGYLGPWDRYGLRERS